MWPDAHMAHFALQSKGLNPAVRLEHQNVQGFQMSNCMGDLEGSTLC